MLILIGFAFLAGAATALSPCVLPVLPVALAAGASGGRRRPLGVVTGLVLTFTFATVALVYVIAALGLPDDLLRNVAIAVLVGFGIALVVPRAAARLEVAFGRAARGRAPRVRGDGFRSGVVLGGSLGLLYAPCAGPILAGVITVSAAQDFTAGRLAVAFAYSAGSGVVLYGLMLGGRRATARLAARGRYVQPAMGAVMLCVAAVMAAGLDLRFQSAIADDLPAVLVNPSRALEQSAAAEEALARLAGDGVALAGARRGQDGRLPVLARAPEIRGTQRWFNTPGGRALSLAELRGRVVLIDFWTYSCINCIRTLPHLRAWDERYRGQGLTVIGVHAPEFPFERDPGNVGDAVREHDLGYAVAQDNDFATWRAYGNRFWPAKYLIDAAGRIRYAHFGEGDYAETEAAIRALLEEAGDTRLGARVRMAADHARAGATPESYLGAERAERVAGAPLVPGTRDFRVTPAGEQVIPLHHLALDGRWHVQRQRSVAAAPGARLLLHFAAQRVFAVLGSPGRPRRVGVLVDGRRRRAVRVDGHRLYEVARLRRPGAHRLTLLPDRGVEAYAFTFG